MVKSNLSSSQTHPQFVENQNRGYREDVSSDSKGKGELQQYKEKLLTWPCACRVTSALCHQILVIPAGRTALQLFLISFMFFRAMVFVSLQRFLQRSSGCESGAQVFRCCSIGSSGLSISKSCEYYSNYINKGSMET